MSDQPFSDMVRALNHRLTFQEIAAGSGYARSSSWFNHVSWNSRRVSPPPPEILPKMADLFEVTEEQVAAMVAESWYGVRNEESSERVRRLAPALDALDDRCAILVEQLVAQLNRIDPDAKNAPSQPSA